MNEFEIEQLISDGKYSEAYDLLQEAEESGNFVSRSRLYENMGFCLMKMDEYPAAKEALSESLSAESPSLNAHYYLGITCFSLGEYEEAVDQLEKVSKQEGLHSELAYHLSLSYFSLNRPKEAMDRLTLLLRDKDSSELLFSIATSLFSVSHADWARDIFVAYLAQFPADPDATFGLGIAYVELREFQKAIECFKRVEKSSEEKFSSLPLMLGMAYFEIGDYPNTKSYLESALKNPSTKTDAYYYLGEVYSASGLRDEAVSAFRAALQREPDMVEAWKKLGLLLFSSEDYTSAMHCMRNAYDLSGDLDSSDKLANIALMAGEYEEALTYFEIAYEKSGNTAYFESIAVCRYYLSDYRGALEDLKRLGDTVTDRFRFHFVRGSSEMRLGDLEQAKSDLQKAVEAAPSDIGALYNFGMVLAALGEYTQSANSFQKALLIERRPEFVYALALSRMKLRDNEEAAELFSEYALHHSENVDRLQKTALMLTSLGAKSEAAQAFRRLLELDPGNETALKYLKELEDE